MRDRPFFQPALVLAVIVAMTAVGLIRHGGAGGNQPYRLETFRTADDGLIEGALYSEHNDRVVLLCHGAVFDKESWSELAMELREADIDAFAIDFRGYGNSTAPTPDARELDVLGAIGHLEEKGYEEIGIVGGSMGGQAVLRALARETPPAVDRVAILAAAGPGIETEQIEKLFVVARRDGMYSGVLETFAESRAPKDIQVFTGSGHAQHLFRGRHAEELTHLLVRFFEA